MAKVLGKGLGALIKNYSSDKNNNLPDYNLDINKITPNVNQPRQTFDSKAMQSLAESIKEKGILQPLAVRKVNDNSYELIAGERRLRAAQMVGLKKVPVFILSIKDESEMMELALIENIQRDNLNSIEEAEGYAILNDKYNLSQKEIGRKVSKSRSEIANKLRLLRLPSVIQDSLRSGIIHYGHARALISIQDSVKLLEIFKKIIAQKLTVRESEMLIKSNKKNSVKKIKKNNQHEKLEKKLINYLQTNLSIKKSKKNKGKIIIEFNTRDDLDKIISLILKK